MNLEEARNNIGAEVELDESTKPYGDTFGEFNNDFCEMIENDKELKITGTGAENVFITHKSSNITGDFSIEAKHLKLKPQNYKIHVPTEAESREAQELFFELGYEWSGGSNTVKYSNEPYLYAFKNKTIKRDHARYEKVFNAHNAKKLTLQDLRDMVAKKKGIKSIGVDLASDEDKTVKSCIEPHKEMTWENALRAVADGKEVEYYSDFHGQWWNISGLRISEITGRKKFRIAPQRIILNGEYTKEELLQKIGEME